jgi:hypothetical protein
MELQDQLIWQNGPYDVWQDTSIERRSMESSSFPMLPDNAVSFPDHADLLGPPTCVYEQTANYAATPSRDTQTDTTSFPQSGSQHNLGTIYIPSEARRQTLGSKTIESTLQTDDIGTPILTQKTTFQCWDHGCDGRKFSSLSNYRRHCRERIVTSEAMICCPYCGQRFTRTSGRDAHIERGRCYWANWSTIDVSTTGISDKHIACTRSILGMNDQHHPSSSRGHVASNPWLDNYWPNLGHCNSW